MIDAAIAFWRENVVLSNGVHAALGFGLAIVLQRYIRGQPFVPVAVGWLLLGFALVMHAYAWSG